MKRFYFSLLPWAVFDIALRSSGLDVTWGAGAALFAAAVIFAFERPHHTGALDLAAFVTFSGLLAAALADSDGATFRAFARALATGTLSVVLLGSSLGAPCTGRYTRSVTAPRYWPRPEFRRFNVRLTIVWSATFAGVAGLDLLASQFRSPFVTTAFNWILPLGLVIGAGMWTDELLTRHFDRAEPTISELVETIGDLEFIVGPGRPPRTRKLRVYRGDAPSR
jgi:hypothetical protein